MGRPTQHNHPPRPVRPGEGSKRYASAMRYPNPTPAHPGTAPGPARVAAATAAGTRPDLFPFRTRKLRLPAPMVLHPPGCGRVGHRRLHTTKGGARHGPPFLMPTPHKHTGHTQTHRTPHAHRHIHAHSHTAPTPATVNPTINRAFYLHPTHGHSATHANTA